MQVEIITTWSDFEKLSSEWNQLLTSSSADNLFLTWEWIQAWRESTRESFSPRVIVIRNQGALVGVAPFYIAKLLLCGIVPYRALRMMADVNTGAEYPNVIVAKGFEDRVYPIIVQSLEQNTLNWDCAWLPNWKGWDNTFTTFVEHLASSNKLGFYHRKMPFSAFSLPADMDELYKQMSKSQKTAVRRVIKKISALDDIEFNICETQEQLPAYLDKLYELHYKRWSKVGQEGSFRRRPAMQIFYAAFTPKALDKGWLRIAELQHQGETKAIQIGYIYANAFHQMQEGFDPDFIDGVGNYLRIKFIESCIDEGVTEYDFLGGFSEHKRRWGAMERNGNDLFMWRKSIKTLPFSFAQIWPSGRYLTSANI